MAVDGTYAGMKVDVRAAAGDPASSLVVGVKSLKDNGTASVVVENEDTEGTAAVVVMLGESGEIVAQVPTIIGGQAS